MIKHSTEEILSLTGCGIIEAMGIMARSCGLDQTWQLRPGHEAWGLALEYRKKLKRAGLRAMPCGVVKTAGGWRLIPVRITAQGQQAREQQAREGRPEMPHELVIKVTAPNGPVPGMARDDGMMTPEELAGLLDAVRGPESVLTVGIGPGLEEVYGAAQAREAAALLLRDTALLPGISMKAA